MRTQVLALLGAVAGALAQDTNATIVTDNPADARYIALLEGAVTGRALASSDAFGLGVNFHVSLDGLPEGQGPFSYYLNQDPVPEDGNCTGAGRFDPFARTDDPPCDDGEPQSCVVGDLSGKYGTVEPPRDEVSFHDPYTSLSPNTTAFFGNGSFAVYNATGESVACANFTLLAEGEDPGPAFPEPPAVEEPPVEEPPEEDEDDDFDFGDEFGDDDESDGDFDFGGDDDFDGDFDFGGDGDSDEDFDWGGDGDSDEDFDWGGDGDFDDEFDFGGD